MRKFFTTIFPISLAIFTGTLCFHNKGWGWKRSSAADDMMNFLNATAPYEHKIKRAEITAAFKNSSDDFVTFYQTGESGDAQESWGWKKATTPDDVMNFLNTKSPYTTVIKRAEVVALDKGAYVEFIIFYQAGNEGDPHGGWAWKRATTPGDAMNFLNTKAPYTSIIKRAEVTAVDKKTYVDFVIFYQKGESGDPHGGWGWKKATTEDDVQNFLNGKGAYSKPVASTEIAAINKEAFTEFYVFYTH